MRKTTITSIAALACMLTLAACSSQADSTAAPLPATPTTGAAPTMTSSASSYPRTGHAPDYSWIAGRVTFTKIQGGCTYIYTDPADIQAYEASLTPQPRGVPTVSGPIVSTAVGDTSPPLRDITPQTGPQPAEPPSSRFVPGGPAWDPSTVKDGDYVVLVGRLAGPGDTTEICPGGTAYVAETVIRNP